MEPRDDRTDEGGRASAAGARPARAALLPAVAGDSVPQRVLPPIEEVNNDDLDDGSLIGVIDAVIAHQGLDGGNVESFDSLIVRGIPEIVTSLYKIDTLMTDKREQTPMDKLRDTIRIQFNFVDVNVGTPSTITFPMGKAKDLYPNEARLTGRTYAAALSMGAHVKLTANYNDGRSQVMEVDVPVIRLATIPIMVRSVRCHTRDLPRSALKEIQEDPSEPGGYFIIKNQEWAIDLLENIRFNSLHCHLGMGNEIVRGEFISQAGGPYDNSSQIILRHMNDGSLTVEINSTQFTKVRIPFYVIYRLFGMASDDEIVRTIADPEADDPAAKQIVEIVDTAFHLSSGAFAEVVNELDQQKLVNFVAEKLAPVVMNMTAYREVEHAVQYLNKWLLAILDRSLLPHVGKTSRERGLKLRFLGRLWYKVFLVEQGILPPTDRDSCVVKRALGPGPSYAKMFKTHFNNSAVSPLQKALKRELRNTPFEELTAESIRATFRSVLGACDLGRSTEQAIASGNKTVLIRRRAVTNRLSSQVLERKNPLNYLTSIRTIRTYNASKAAKQTVRADEMRRVHPSYPGYICISRSNDTGEQVGMSKELAVTASVCAGGEALAMKVRLLADPEILGLESFSPLAVHRERLAVVLVNGDWIGCCRDGPALARRYRLLRREGRGVDPRTSIAWDPVTDEVEFWLDAGRLSRPLLIVYDNLEAYDAGCAAAAAARRAGKGATAAAALRVPYRQNVRLTSSHLRALAAGTLTFGDLVAEGVAEWVTPEEAVNCLVAPSLGALRAAREDVTCRYTHCDTPQALLGLAAHVSPFGNHTQPARVTYETNQGRQAGGWYCFTAPWRIDKLRYFQHYIQHPLVDTFVYRYVLPNGMNARVAYMVDREGQGQEDSAVICKGFVDRGGLAGSFYRTERSEIEKGETLGAPDPTATKNLKPGASYEKLVGGLPPVGTIIQKGDVIIGKFARNPAAAGGRAGAGAGAGAGANEPLYIDRSTVHKLSESAIVASVYRLRGPLDTEFVVVRLRHFRPVIRASKLSSRSGNKAIVAQIRTQSDMPYNEDGVCPDLIINPHSLPTRMTVGQMLETSQSIICQDAGAIADGSFCRPFDVSVTADELVARGFRCNGKERLYDGVTGEFYDVAIFVGPTFHQLLQKFVQDDEYTAGGRGPTDAVTGQPLNGKSAQGGLRLGEMEFWVLESQGAMAFLREKTAVDCDGRLDYVCRVCGRSAEFNSRAGVYRCRTCRDLAEIYAIDTKKAAILFRQEVEGMNVSIRRGLRPPEFPRPYTGESGPARAAE